MSLNNPKISIIVASYNNASFFKDCYNSLINQTEKDWEAIVIDDFSTDNSVSVIKELIKGDSRFKFYSHNYNIGYQKTLIEGIGLISSEIFGRLDSDDALAPNAIKVSLEAHLKYPEVGLVYSNYIICNDMLEIIDVHKGKQVDESIFLKGEISHFATFKKTIYQKTLGIDYTIRRAEDQDNYMKMAEVGPVMYIDEDLYLYRLHKGGMSTNVNRDKAYFWHWVAIIKAAERRGINVEDNFLEDFERKYRYNEINNKLNKLKKNRWYKLGLFLGLIKNMN